MRKQLSLIASAILAGGGASATSVSLTAVRSGTNDVAFRAKVGWSDPMKPDQPAMLAQVADDAGRVRSFKDVDDFLKQAGALGMVAAAIDVKFDGLELLAPKPFTGDIVKKNENVLGSFTKRIEAATARGAVLKKEIALMAADASVPKSLKDEKAAQKAAIDELVSWLNVETQRISALLSPARQDFADRT